MPPLFAPNQPLPSTYAPPGGWAPSGDPSSSGSGLSAYDAEYFRRMDQYIATVAEAQAASAGFERTKLTAQLEDAKKARQNALAIARLSAETSRYGTDVGRQNLLDQLEQNQRQFDANHGLEMQKLGLSRADTATNFMATADRYAQAGNYLALSGRVLAGQPGVGSYGSAVQSRGNTEQDFNVLAGGGNPYAGRGDAMTAAGSGGAGADARVKALKALNDVPPSAGDGLDPNDFAVLRATAAIRGMRLTPQQQAAIGSSKEYQQILGSNLRNLGENPDAWFQRQRQRLPGQGAARSA